MLLTSCKKYSWGKLLLIHGFCWIKIQYVVCNHFNFFNIYFSIMLSSLSKWSISSEIAAASSTKEDQFRTLIRSSSMLYLHRTYPRYHNTAAIWTHSNYPSTSFTSKIPRHYLYLSVGYHGTKHGTLCAYFEVWL